MAAGAWSELCGEAYGPRTRAWAGGSVRGAARRTATGLVSRSCASGVARSQLALSGVLDDRRRRFACCMTFCPAQQGKLIVAIGQPLAAEMDHKSRPVAGPRCRGIRFAALIVAEWSQDYRDSVGALRSRAKSRKVSRAIALRRSRTTPLCGRRIDTSPSASGRRGVGTSPPGPARASVTSPASTHHQHRPRSPAVTSRPQPQRKRAGMPLQRVQAGCPLAFRPGSEVRAGRRRRCRCAAGPAGSSTCRPAPPASYRRRRGSTGRSAHREQLDALLS